ncbi:MAG: hypothetical protein GY863_04740, partial [bacterium]|nr:hypothetical protein [bacterium]
MRNSIFIYLIYILIFLLTNGCSKDQPIAPEITGPVCSITSPSNRATFSKGDTIEISVDASDENSTIHYVQFIIDGEIKFW